MKILAVGPWIGEFGWELFQWQSYIRYIAQDFDKVIVSSRPGHEILYSDFCDEFIPFESDINDCCGWTDYSKSKSLKYIDADVHITPDHYMEGEQIFSTYGNKDKSTEYDIVIHPRAVQTSSNFKTEKYEKKSSRNWDIDKWNELSKIFIGKKVCTIGVSGSSFLVDNTEDNRDISLIELSNILASSKLCIGPSSGPMHFASLCCCPHLVWTSSKNVEKYQTKWNPFGTPVKIHINENWDPEPSDIIEDISSWAIIIY